MQASSHLAIIETFGDVRFWSYAAPASLCCVLSAKLQQSDKADKREWMQVVCVFSLLLAVGLVAGAFFTLGLAGGIGAGVMSFFLYGLGMGWAR